MNLLNHLMEQCPHLIWAAVLHADSSEQHPLQFWYDCYISSILNS